MKELLQALNSELSGLYTAQQVFQNYASGDISFPYITFKYNGSGPSESYATTSNTSGYIQEQDILIQYLSDDDADAEDNIETIIDHLHGTDIELETFNIAEMWLLSKDLLVDPEKSASGDPVYIASAIFSFKLIKK